MFLIALTLANARSHSQNLYLQFNKKANLYFLGIAILSLFPLSPKPWWVSVLPLLFVLTVSAVKEAIEDWHRYLQDKQINSTLVLAWRDNAFTPIEWQHVVVGDILKVVENGSFPADMVLLQSSLSQGICNIETANLDGYGFAFQPVSDLLFPCCSLFPRLVHLHGLCQ